MIGEVVDKIKEEREMLENCQRTGWSKTYMGYPDMSFWSDNMKPQVTADNRTVYYFVVSSITRCCCDRKECKCPTEDYVCIKYGHPMYYCCDKIHLICKLSDIWSE